jgi:DNA (cytosine-5)-methyltransferase 1
VLTVGSLFSGIGGFDLGFERAGFEVVWQVEIDDWCRKVLAKHWPKVRRFSDVRGVSGGDLGIVDVICGGFPCQDISNAGTTHEGGLQGLDGERSGLWSEFYRIVCELQPRWVAVENVGALTVRGLDRVLYDLAAGGFDADWSVLSAAALGAPHLRKRLLIVARRAVRFAHELPECDCCGEPWCDECGEHYFECSHPGPHNWDEVLEDADSTRLEGSVGSVLAQPNDWRHHADAARPAWVHAASRVLRSADGVPGRVDRLRGIGNAIVPQVAQFIAEQIKQAEANDDQAVRPDEGNPTA